MGIRCSSGLLLVCSMIGWLAPPAAQAKPVPVASQELGRLKRAAEKGGVREQLAYGKALCDAGRSEDCGKWLQRAADHGSAEAWFQLGYHAAGSKEPSYYYEKAAERGYAEAFGYVLEELLLQRGSKADVAKAKRFADLARKLGVSFGWDLQVIDRCAEAGEPKLPASDLPTAQEAGFFKKDVGRACERYRRGPKKNLARYGKCVVGLLGRCLVSTCTEEHETDFGRVVLAEAYANGWGVKRNPTLAIALVCHGSDVQAELEGMVDTLYTTRGQKRLKKEFTFCEHVTSGRNGGWCAAMESRAADEERDRSFERLARKWTASQKQALAELKQTAFRFFDKHSTAEQDMTGTARAEIAFDEENALKDALLKSLRQLEAGKLPTGLDAGKIEREHAAVYGRLMKSKKLCDDCTMTSAGVREVQKLWLSYREAWVKLGLARWPRTPAETWRAWVTQQRTKQLSELVKAAD